MRHLHLSFEAQSISSNSSLDVPEFSDPFAGVHAFARLRLAAAAQH
jgi:hypothetical protein